MNRVLLFKGLIFLFFLVGFSAHEAELIKEIDNKYHSAKSITDLSKLESLVKKYIEVFPKSHRLLWRLGRIYFKLGDKTTNESEKVYFFSLCIKQTQKTIKINSRSANSYFFKGLCNGTLGEIQGMWSSLTIIEPFKKDMETTISLDPSIEEGGPHRALGNLYSKLPYILGGDLSRSIGHFKKAISLGSEFGENYLGLAEAYIKNDELVLARATLSKIINMKFNSQNAESILSWQKKANRLFKKIVDN
jgi:tetratricopeptide (TPR) repeat protein